MTPEILENLMKDISEARKGILASKIQRYPANNFRSSDIHECNRYMVYSINDWKERSLHDESLQAIFDAGHKEERNVLQRLDEAGFSVIEQQTAFEVKNREGDVICRGHIDGKILYNGIAIPIEIKSMNENIFNSINRIEDFQKKPHLRKYLRQMQLYLYGHNIEFGLFILSNFRTEKLIPVVLDYGECEMILQRLEKNWEFKKKNEYPDRIPFDDSICGRCPFKHICLPDVKNPGANMIDNQDLEEKLERREELKVFVDEYDEIDSSIKSTFREIPEAYIGTKFKIQGSWRTSNSVDAKALPEDIKKEYAIEKKAWYTRISKL